MDSAYFVEGYDFEVKTTVKELLQAVTFVLPTVSPKDVVNGLSDVLFVVNKNEVILTTTNVYTASVYRMLNVTTINTGQVLIEAAKIYKGLRESNPDSVLRIVVKGTVVLISTSDTEWVLSVRSSSIFPKLDIKATYVDLDLESLLYAIRGTEFAAASDGTRPNLACVSIAGRRAQACNGVILQEVTLPKEIPHMLLPSAKINLLLRYVTSLGSATIKFGETSRSYIFASGNGAFVVSRNSLEYPDVSKIFLRSKLQNDMDFGVSKSELAKAVARASVTANKEADCLVIELKTGKALVSCVSNSGMSASTTIPCDWSHKGMFLKLSISAINRVLSIRPEDRLLFKVSSPTKGYSPPVALYGDNMVTIINQENR